MTKKKSGFWTFIFSLLPGAAEMYMGFMKMGISLMGLFFGLFIIGGFFGQSIFVLADIVVWFYAFFHAHNLRAMDDEEFYALEDDYLFHLDGSGKELWNKMGESRYRKLAAVVLILIGVSILWNNLLDLLWYLLPDFLEDIVYTISYRIPQTVLGIAIIVAGVWMIRGKKKELLDGEEKEEEANGRETDDTNA
ncbi:hypothetical protein B5E77_15720 [Lachnoclostridium sp. An131]|uniref:hypothetical protein n=1 Tax=Lachnoclostridium sp. An131 TaxID=1965555 RepID=UPI000B57671D|nr:hypothetical protein [Lachnoclostridium sp. An131]OUQ23342.1 hypothetical protein B5E77_15720 [Lachnoclostridium sp. An131]